MRVLAKIFANQWQDGCATVVRLSFDVRVSVAILSPRNFGEFTTRQFRDTCTNVVRQSHDSLEKACKHMMETCPCNVYPLKPHLDIAKLGYTGVYLFFLSLVQNIDCEYSLEPPRRGGSNVYPPSLF